MSIAGTTPKPHQFAGLTFFISSILLCFSIPARAAAPDSPPASIKVYDPDPAHLLNRFHQALFVRVAADGTRFDPDALDPVIYHESRFLLQRAGRIASTAVLDEFIKTAGQRPVQDALKAAILQRDLWTLFDWSVHDGPRDEELVRARTALRGKVGTIIHSLALTPEQIAALPDTYAAAIASKQFAARYDPDKPRQPFLPDDLLPPTGPWVAVAADAGLTAPIHVNDLKGRYAFDLFMNLPGGRAATIEFLDRAGEQMPPLPRGAQVALLRRTLLIDREGNIRATRLIESVQIRVIRQTPRPPTRAAQGVSADPGEVDAYELVRSRAKLFAADAGGLRPVTPDESQPWFPEFRAHEFDPIEEHDRPGRAQGRPIEVSPMLGRCIVCHATTKLETFEMFNRYGAGETPRRHRLIAIEKNPLDFNSHSIIKFKTERQDWRDLASFKPSAKPTPAD